MQNLKMHLMLALLVSASALSAQARVPRSLAVGVNTLSSSALGGTCYSIDTGSGLPCNAAQIVNPTEKHFFANIFASNSVSYLQDVRALMDHQANAGTVESLFSQTHDAEMELSTELAYRRRNFGVSLTPYQLKYYSFLRNRALPQLTMLASQEENLRIQFGGHIGEDSENEGSWGVEIRGVHRKFISNSFSLTDTLVDGKELLLATADQTAVYVEPGIVRKWSDHHWRPQISLVLAQLGFVDYKHPDFYSSPELHLGGSVSPPISIGMWTLGLDLNLSAEMSRWSDPIRLGSSYEVGTTRIMSSFGASDYALGFQMRYGAGTAGLVYQSRWLENWICENEWVQTLSLQVGLEF